MICSRAYLHLWWRGLSQGVSQVPLLLWWDTSPVLAGEILSALWPWASLGDMSLLSSGRNLGSSSLIGVLTPLRLYVGSLFSLLLELGVPH